MGVAMFAARKISLINSISNLECMRMQISSQQQALSDQACNLAMQQSNVQISALGMQQQQQQQGSNGSSNSGNGNSWGQIAGALGSIFGTMYGGAEGGQYGAAIGSAAGSIGDMFSNNGSSSQSYGQQSQGTNPAFIAAQQENMQIQQQLMMIQQQEKRLEATAKTLETQLGLKNKELEGVEKAEEKAIERSAPKFA